MPRNSRKVSAYQQERREAERKMLKAKHYQRHAPRLPDEPEYAYDLFLDYCLLEGERRNGSVKTLIAFYDRLREEAGLIKKDSKDPYPTDRTLIQYHSRFRWKDRVEVADAAPHNPEDIIEASNNSMLSTPPVDPDKPKRSPSKPKPKPAELNEGEERSPEERSPTPLEALLIQRSQKLYNEQQKIISRHVECSQRIWELVDRMMKHPIVEKKISQEDGTTIHIHPAGWNMGDMARLAKTALEIDRQTHQLPEKPLEELAALYTIIRAGWLPPEILDLASSEVQGASSRIRESIRSSASAAIALKSAENPESGD